jgi:hypothetical protein
VTAISKRRAERHCGRPKAAAFSTRIEARPELAAAVEPLLKVREAAKPVPEAR